MTFCKLEDVVVRHKKARQARKATTRFVVEIIASENHRPPKGRSFDPVQQSFNVKLIERRVARRSLETDVGGH